MVRMERELAESVKTRTLCLSLLAGVFKTNSTLVKTRFSLPDKPVVIVNILISGPGSSETG